MLSRLGLVQLRMAPHDAIVPLAFIPVRTVAQIPVDPRRSYIFSIWIRSTSPGMVCAKPHVSCAYLSYWSYQNNYLGFYAYDSNKNQITGMSA
jgi:hypothetical protein